MKTKFTAKAVILALCVSSTLSAKTFTKINPISITAKKYPTAFKDLGQDVQIITGEEIKDLGIQEVSEALKLLNDVAVYNASGQLSITVGGQASNSVLIMIDGVPLYDASTPQGTPFLDNLILTNIDRIEYVPGGQGALYGARAVAGVINIITTNKNKITVVGSTEDYNKGVITKTIPQQNGSTYFTYAYERDNRFSSLFNSTEKDGFDYRNIKIGTKQNMGKHRFHGFYQNNHSTVALDSVSSPLVDDPNFENQTQHNLYHYEISGPLNKNLLYRMQYSISEVFRDSSNPTDNIDSANGIDSRYYGLNKTLDLSAQLRPNKAFTAIIGVEQLSEAISFDSVSYSSFGPWPTSRQLTQQTFNSIYIDTGLKTEPINIQTGIRSQDNNTTYTANLFREFKYFNVGLNLRTGYREGTLYERFYNSSVDRKLKPETSLYQDIVLSKKLNHAFISFRQFKNKVKDRIAYDNNSTPNDFSDDTYYNLSQNNSTSSGTHYHIGLYNLGIISFLTADASHIITKEKKKSTGDAVNRILRIPSQKYTLATALKLGKLTWGIQYQHIGNRAEYGPVIPIDMDEYDLWHTSLAYNTSKTTQYFLKIDNVFNLDYVAIPNIETSNRFIRFGLSNQF